MKIISLIFLTILVITLSYLILFTQKKDIFYLGLVGPMSGVNAELGASLRKGADMAIKEINSQAELENIELQLFVADDQSESNSKYAPVETARQVVKQEKLLAIVGHYFSTPTLAAAPIYTKHQIPIIMPTGTHPTVTASSEWVFSIMFTDEVQAAFLANYTVYGLKKNNIAVIYSELAYGKTLKEHFVTELAKHQKQPQTLIAVPHHNLEPKVLAAHLEQLQPADMIFLSMRYDNAAKVIKYLKNKRIKADFIGGENIGSTRFIREAGIYAEGVYAVTSFLPNLLGEQARIYEQNFKNAFQTRPEWDSAHAYEAVKLIAQAIKAVGTDPVDIKNYLKQLRDVKTGVQSIGGQIYFDRYGANLRPISIGQVKNGKYTSADFQLISVKYPKQQPDKQQLVYFNHHYLKRSTVVFTGVYVNKIKEFDTSRSTYVAQFILWFRWNGQEKPQIDFELTNGTLRHQREMEQYHDEKTGESYVSYEITAAFTKQFPLHDYPFDKQVLNIQIRPKDASIEDILLVSDLADETLFRKKFQLGLWQEIKHLHYVDLISHISSIRNPQFDQKLYRLDYSLFNYDIHVSRKVKLYLIKLMPLLIVVLVTYVTFYLREADLLSTRLIVQITALLSAVAFHMSQNNNVINIGYLIKSDYFFMITYWLIFFSIVGTVVYEVLLLHGKQTLAVKFDNYVPSLFLLLMMSSFLVIYL